MRPKGREKNILAKIGERWRLLLAMFAAALLAGCTTSADELSGKMTFVPPATAENPKPTPVTQEMTAKINFTRIFTDTVVSAGFDPLTGRWSIDYNSNPNAASQKQFGADMLGAFQAGAGLVTGVAAKAAGVP